MKQALNEPKPDSMTTLDIKEQLEEVKGAAVVQIGLYGTLKGQLKAAEKRDELCTEGSSTTYPEHVSDRL